MVALVQDDQQRRAAMIDEATRDWLESQVFPTTRIISKEESLQHLTGEKSRVKQSESGTITGVRRTDRIAA